MKSINEFQLTSKVKRKVFAIMLGLGIPLLIDVALYVGDQLFGVEEGVMFTYRLVDLMLVSNGICAVLALLYFFSPFLMSLNQRLPKNSGAVGSILPNVRAYLRKGFLASKPIIKNLLVSIASIVFIVGVIELVFYILLQQKNSTYSDITFYENASPYFYRTDEYLGLAGVPNVQSTHVKYVINTSTHDSTEVFKTQVSIDSNGMRTVNIPHLYDRKKYALFMGCSFTFGIGVNDDETIPANFARKDTTYCPYNFGIGGWGPQNALARFQFTDVRKIVKQDSGFCIYTYIADHVPRAIGDMKTYERFASKFPYYDYQNDSLQYMGSFDKDRILTSTFYTIASKSNFIEYFNINFPLVLKDRHYKLTCDLIYAVYQQYKKNFKNDEFYVLIYPGQTNILPYLSAYDLKVIMYEDMFKDREYADYFIENDGHPNALANDVLTDRLVHTIDSLHRLN